MSDDQIRTGVPVLTNDCGLINPGALTERESWPLSQGEAANGDANASLPPRGEPSLPSGSQRAGSNIPCGWFFGLLPLRERTAAFPAPSSSPRKDTA